MELGKTTVINDTDTILGKPKKLILFNDDMHSMDQVVDQLRKATGYDETQCISIMMEADQNGRAVVYTGHLERCEHIESILAQIKLGTKIEDA